MGEVHSSYIIPTVNQDVTLTFTTDKFSTYALAYATQEVDTTKLLSPNETTSNIKPTGTNTKPAKTPHTGITSNVLFYAFVEVIMTLLLGWIIVAKRKLDA